MDSIKFNVPYFKAKKIKKNSPVVDPEKKEFIPSPSPNQHNISSHRNRFADVISQGVKKMRRKQSDD